MSSTLTTANLISWMSASTDSALVLDATPSAVSLAHLQRCLDSAIQSVESYCAVATVVPADVELATLMLAARLWKRRGTPDGIQGFNDFGVVRVSRFDADIESLLEPYRAWRFS